MSITISPQTNILAGAAGGLLIAGSTTLLLSLIGEMATMSGLVHAMLRVRDGALTGWRSSFVAGLLGAGVAATLLNGGGSGSSGVDIFVRPGAVLAAGALVGFGTRLGNGCTSGHGVCGLSRFSPRSLAAVACFMSTGMITAVSVSSIPALRSLVFERGVLPSSWGTAAVSLLAAGAVVAAGRLLVHPYPATAAPAAPASATHPSNSLGVHVAALASGAAFGAGLVLSGMASPAKVLGFLNPWSPGGWDLTLMGVMGAAVAFNAVSFARLHALRTVPALRPNAQPLNVSLALGPSHPRNVLIDARLMVGSALFGVGWGVAGVCPGPAVVAVGGGAAYATAFVPAMLLGMLLYDLTLGGGRA